MLNIGRYIQLDTMNGQNRINSNITSPNHNGNHNGNHNDNHDIIIQNTINLTINKFKTDLVFKSHGWYHKNQHILKYLDPKNSFARCIQCYDLTHYDDINYSRIIHLNTNMNTNITTNTRYTDLDNSGSGLVICICSNCSKKIMDGTDKSININIKMAPKTYGDILADYISNGRYDLIYLDIDKSSQKDLNQLDERIHLLKFNINEKKVIINKLQHENEVLGRNIDVEIEKFNTLNEHKNKNKELFEKIKSSLLQLNIDLFRENRKIIDEQINKYNELNNMSKYTIPECKICMQREIKMVIQCGHALCHECYWRLDKIDQPDSDTILDGGNMITCPICRTTSNTYTQIYL